MADDSDRRVYPRVPLRMLVQFRLDDMDVFLREYAVNISAGGMFIRSVQPYEHGSMVYLQFRLRDGHKLIEGLGKVVHINPPSHHDPGIGVEFVNLDADSRLLIDEIVAERLCEASAPRD